MLWKKELNEVNMVRVLLFLCTMPCVFGLSLNLDDHWTIFKKTFSKTYNSDTEEVKRRNIFEKNIAVITQHNLQADMGKYTYKLGVNQLCDMSLEEYQQKHAAMLIDKTDMPLGRNIGDAQTLPPTPMKSPLDFRKQGLVGPVMSEGHCNCSYAFAAVGNLEAELARKNGKFVALSVQQIIDCSGPQGNLGCTGGNVENAFKSVIKAGGINDANTYPYIGIDPFSGGPACHASPSSFAAKCSYSVRASPDEQGMYTALNNVGPVTVAINAGLPSFQFYSSGIYDDPNCTNSVLNRALLAVGYGAEGDNSFWILKNSLGATWGESGYIRLIRGKNRCGVLDYIVYAKE